MKYFFLNIIIFTSSFIFSQTYKAVYKISQLNITDQEKNKQSENFSVLIFSDNKSVYEQLENNPAKAEIPRIVFKNFDQNIKITQTSFFGEGINIKEDLASLDWINLNQSKQVNQMKCSLYHTQIKDMWNKVQTVHACVDKSIPVLDGPENYTGLPGLIVELLLPDKKFELTEIKILKNNTSLKEPVNSFKTLSKEQYDRWTNENMEKMMEDMNKREGLKISSEN